MKSYKEYKSKLTYETNDPLIREASKIELEMPSDLTIHEFKTMCIRLAHTIGYHENSIDRAFGDVKDQQSKNDRTMWDLIKTINEKDNE